MASEPPCRGLCGETVVTVVSDESGALLADPFEHPANIAARAAITSADLANDGRDRWFFSGGTDYDCTRPQASHRGGATESRPHG